MHSSPEATCAGMRWVKEFDEQIKARELKEETSPYTRPYIEKTRY